MEYDLDSYLKYEERLRRCVDDHLPDIIYNDSIVHAAMIYSQMFRKAKNEGNAVNMYCGELSVFRDSTRVKISDELLISRNNDGKATDEMWQAFHPYENMVNSITDFLKEGGKLNIVMEKRGSRPLASEKCYPLLKEAYDKGQLYIRVLPFSVGLDHFSIAGDAYRAENSDIKKSALCSFCDQKATEIYQKSFDLLMAMSAHYDLMPKC